MQMEGDAVEAVAANAEQLSPILKPMYKELQVCGSLAPVASTGNQHNQQGVSNPLFTHRLWASSCEMQVLCWRTSINYSSQ